MKLNAKHRLTAAGAISLAVVCKSSANALKYANLKKRITVKLSHGEEADICPSVELWEKGKPPFLQYTKSEFNAIFMKIWKTTGTDLLEICPLADGSGILIYGYYRD